MSVGSWVETNVVLPLGNLLLEPANLQKIAAVFEPALERLFANAAAQVGSQITASELKVINTIGAQALASEKAVLGPVEGLSNSITGSITTAIDNAIKGLNPFHLGVVRCPECGNHFNVTTG